MNSTWDPLISAIPMKIWIVKEVVGPMHSARDPLTDTPIWNVHVKKKKCKLSTMDANPNTYHIGKLLGTLGVP